MRQSSSKRTLQAAMYQSSSEETLPQPGDNPTSDDPATDDPTSLEQELSSLPESDLLRLKAIAQWRVHGLPGLSWSDILNEAIMRGLSGDRQKPPGTPLVVFLAWTMRSICNEHWRRLHKESPILTQLESRNGEPLRDPADDSPSAFPERTVAAAQMVARLCQLFAGDEVIMKIILGLAQGLTAREICAHCQLTAAEYDAARKRMRRALLRHGLGDCKA